jgi:hypothetical protein
VYVCIVSDGEMIIQVYQANKENVAHDIDNPVLLVLSWSHVKNLPLYLLRTAEGRISDHLHRELILL